MDAIQLKMARVALGLTVRQAAELSETSHDTITRLEAGQALKDTTIAKVRSALEAAGVVFLADGEQADGGPGVRLKKRD